MVNICADGIKGLYKKLNDKELICFGAGEHFNTVMELYATYGLYKRVSLILDNNIKLWGNVKRYKEYEYCIESIKSIKGGSSPSIIILITCHLYSMDIVEQLDSIPWLDGVDVYLGSFLSDDLNYKCNYIVEQNQEIKIPKIIHYCWFGGKELPDEYQKYIKTWREKCPDYEIKRWDENNFDVTQNLYMEQAYSVGKWAFVSDYARVKIIHDEGGIYLDCDVELLRNLNNLLGDEFYCGFEDSNHVNFGLGFGAVKEHPILKQLLDVYEKLVFLNNDKTMNMTPCTAYQTDIVERYGIVGENVFQRKNGIAVYPTEVFAPISPWGIDNRNESAYSIHHYSASWQSLNNMNRVMNMYSKYYCRVKGRAL